MDRDSFSDDIVSLKISYFKFVDLKFVAIRNQKFITVLEKSKNRDKEFLKTLSKKYFDLKIDIKPITLKDAGSY